MSAHLLTIDGVDEGTPCWNLRCTHDKQDTAWWFRDEPNDDGTPGLWSINIGGDRIEGCWLQSWWEGVGAELINFSESVDAYPIHVRPSDDWGYDSGGSLVIGAAVGGDTDR